ncbi:MAG: serine hydrolase domain-containing protein [Ignavibacteriaceae bacterium]|jgi:CubicO group peptidase (beta-lactamase class C family)|nr:serine hydrolase domain-containing protein [Ignavibacteriaceae bacterium]
MTKNKSKPIVRLLRIVMPTVALLSLIVFPPWKEIWLWIAPMHDTVQEEMNIGIEHGLDGIIVFIDKGDEQPEFYSAGWKNRENRTPADPHALFKIASISKLYVAASAAMLVNDKQLSLDKPLTYYLPELSGRIEFGDKITLRQMLQHRSGIPNLTDHPDYPWGNPPQNNEEALKYALDLPADFNPGEDYAYSNTNYLLISEIMDKVLGYSHHQFIKERIIIPLGLKNTFSSIKEVDIDKVMSGYSVGWELDVKNNYHASMIATAEDVGIFLRALIDGTLFTDEEQKIYSSIYVYEHTGLVPGYYSIARYHKDIDTIIIQCVNTNGGNSEWISNIIYDRIVKLLHQ